MKAFGISPIAYGDEKQPHNEILTIFTVKLGDFYLKGVP